MTKPFVMLPYDVLTEWNRLSRTAMMVYVDMRKRMNSYNNGRIRYGTRDAKAIGISQGAAQRAIDALQEAGLIKMATEHGFCRARRWEIIDRSEVN